jgi:chlorite dismutase
MGDFLSNVLAYKFRSSWWKLTRESRIKVIDDLKTILKETHEKNNQDIKAEIYSSLRPDSNLIFWLLLKDSTDLNETRARLGKVFGSYASLKYGFLSVYEANKLKDSSGKEYFVSYPISKSPEWYLLPKEKRTGIMAEHIRLATSDVNNKGINSYTTTSFGIDDNEFVVLYELNSIPEWVAVTTNLREAEARKWITNEKPILVGSKSNFKEFLI